MEINKTVVKQTMGDGDGNTQIAEQNIYYTYQKKEAVVQECHVRYRNDWKKPMFLTENVKLCDLYRLPNYKCKSWEKRTNLEERLRIVLKASNDIEKRMLLILGHPGNGKTTLMTYILNHYSDEIIGRKVRMYCFRSFKKINWNDRPENLFGIMLVDMGLHINDLNNSVLILDGLDEVNMSNSQVEFLNSLCEDWAESSEIINFSLFITCRVNRISEEYKLVCPHIQLCPLEEEQIGSFVEKYNSFDSSSVNTKESMEKLIQNNKEIKDVLGIPLILYMVLSLHIRLNKETNLVEIYNLIFSTNENENSIYIRDNYDHTQAHEITKNAAPQIHQFSKEIAIHMWKDKNKEAVIKKREYEEIADKVAPNKKVRDLLIGQYFIEGKDSYELYFVHRSMYQYFVALSIFDSIKGMMGKGSPSNQFEELQNNSCTQKDSEITSFAKIIGIDLIYSDPDIEQYLLYMLKDLNLFIEEDQWWKSFFACFVDKGLTRYIDDYKESSLKCFNKELNRFYNLIWLTREQLKNTDSSQLYYKVAEVDEKFCFFLRQRNKNHVDLNKIYLSGADLSGADLKGANLLGADLSRVDLKGAYLLGADLSEADLSEADLAGAVLAGAGLSEADLSGANLAGAVLEGSDLSEAELRKVILDEENYKKFFGDESK